MSDEQTKSEKGKADSSATGLGVSLGLTFGALIGLVYGAAFGDVALGLLFGSW